MNKARCPGWQFLGGSTRRHSSSPVPKLISGERATILTSNDPVEQLRDDRIISRITGTCHLLTVVAYDYRLLGHAADVA